MMNVQDLPKGVTLYAVVPVHATKLNFATAERNGVYCYRCGELGHRKSECLHWKTRKCAHFDQGQCFRMACPFAHGSAELRNPHHTSLKSSGWSKSDASAHPW
jgi:hypothetical protein